MPKVNIAGAFADIPRSDIAAVHEASEQDTDNAVAAAKAAFPAWSQLSPDQRGQYFKKLAKLIRENNDELAALEASSMGRPVGEFYDAHMAADKWERFAECGYIVQGEHTEMLENHDTDSRQAPPAFRLRVLLT